MRLKISLNKFIYLQYNRSILVRPFGKTYDSPVSTGNLPNLYEQNFQFQSSGFSSFVSFNYRTMSVAFRRRRRRTDETPKSCKSVRRRFDARRIDSRHRRFRFATRRAKLRTSAETRFAERRFSARRSENFQYPARQSRQPAKSTISEKLISVFLFVQSVINKSICAAVVFFRSPRKKRAVGEIGARVNGRRRIRRDV